jgi:hypothetical protein
MSDWSSRIAAGEELPQPAASELEDRGFVVLHGDVAAGSMERLTAAYTAAMTSATVVATRRVTIVALRG